VWRRGQHKASVPQPWILGKHQNFEKKEMYEKLGAF
jgi:hypothetical protein